MHYAVYKRTQLFMKGIKFGVWQDLPKSLTHRIAFVDLFMGDQRRFEGGFSVAAKEVPIHQDRSVGSEFDEELVHAFDVVHFECLSIEGEKMVYCASDVDEKRLERFLEQQAANLTF